MMKSLRRCALMAALGSMLLSGVAQADALITNFDNFVSDALYPSWALPSSTVVSGPTSYNITATGYGSNYKYIGFPEIVGAGNNTIELTVNLSGPAAADGMLGPIIGLIDGDGTHVNYAWYGQTLGSHVLTMPVDSPTWTAVAGSTPGLDLNTLTHMHMQLDPGGFASQGQYTIQWQNLRLTNVVPEPATLTLAACAGALVLGCRRQRAKQ
ncbi:hypothetical protein [Lacipirellula sp.]|uniref:hypothetical protein n=1 Tax=Lacipirellula sp. TaxID=2691419 RepID=UPI003D0B1330